MLIGGAGGHAIEILDILLETNSQEEIAFFDDVTDVQNVHGSFLVLKDETQARDWLSRSKHFCIGAGGVKTRQFLYRLLSKFGGELIGVRARTAEISSFSNVDSCVDVCKQVFISSLAAVGRGTLVNTGARIHHHVHVGMFCEISPGSTLLGGVTIGDYCSVGSGAVVLPKISVCKNVVIGAGSIVTRNIFEPGTYVGNPARRVTV